MEIVFPIRNSTEKDNLRVRLPVIKDEMEEEKEEKPPTIVPTIISSSPPNSRKP